MPNVENNQLFKEKSIDKENLTKSLVKNCLYDMQGTEDRPAERAFRHLKRKKEKKKGTKPEEKKKAAWKLLTLIWFLLER